MIDKKFLKQLSKGILSWIPGTDKLIMGRTGGTNSARYCYSVWFRHFLHANYHEEFGIPKIVAELGPGDSLGVGMAALISGANKYYAFDVINHAYDTKILEMFDELVELFNTRASIPDDVEFPNTYPRLKSYSFPSHILTEEVLATTLDPNRIKDIRSKLSPPFSNDSPITFFVPWSSSQVPSSISGTVDFLISQAVLEYIEDLASTHVVIKNWMREGGIASHQVDFRSHDTSDNVQGHWLIGDISWWLLRGRRKYALSRYPHSSHVSEIRNAGFVVLADNAVLMKPAIDLTLVQKRFSTFPFSDYQTAHTCIVCKKPVIKELK